MGKKATKKKRAPKIKRGSFRRVWNGSADRTKGGLTKADLCVNKRGRVVSKKAHAVAQKRFKTSGMAKWVAAAQRARKELKIKGFVLCKKGSAYYKLARKFYGK